MHAEAQLWTVYQVPELWGVFANEQPGYPKAARDTFGNLDGRPFLHTPAGRNQSDNNRPR